MTTSQKRFQVLKGNAEDLVPTVEPVDVIFTHPPYGKENLNVLWKAKLKPGGVIFVGLGDPLGWESVGRPWELLYWQRDRIQNYVVWYDPRFDQLHYFFQLGEERVELPRLIVESAEVVPGYPYSTTSERVIRSCLSSFKGDDWTVLDPFCGTGSTGRVANELGGDFIGIDIEPFVIE